jgi:hypothetical protein
MKGMKNKKAQLGQTITWVVATVVIILILALLLFFAQEGKVRKVFSGDIERHISFGEQQMLFAMLNYQDGKIKGLIEQGNMGEAEKEVDSLLTKFEQEGIKCGFTMVKGIRLYGIDKRGVEKYYQEPLIKINGWNLRLECD